MKINEVLGNPAGDPLLNPEDSVLAEAHNLVRGKRRNSYGDVRISFESIAAMWTVILKTRVTPDQVALCMVATKICRETGHSKRDNWVDIAGYAELGAGLAKDQCTATAPPDRKEEYMKGAAS